MKLSVLHISDLYRDPENPIRNDILLDSLEIDRRHYTAEETTALRPPDLIIVSGDIIQGIRPEEHVARLVNLIEAEASKDLAETPAADQNQQFQQYILSHGQIALAKNVTITVLPSGQDVALGRVAEHEPDKPKHFYTGSDATILKRFATEQANLLHVSQSAARRKLQLQYLKQFTKIEEVPEKAIVERIPDAQLTVDAVARETSVERSDGGSGHGIVSTISQDGPAALWAAANPDRKSVV